MADFTDPIDDVAGHGRTKSVCPGEGRPEQAELDLLQAHFSFEQRRNRGQRHAVGVIEEGDPPEDGDQVTICSERSTWCFTPPQRDECRVPLLGRHPRGARFWPGLSPSFATLQIADLRLQIAQRGPCRALHSAILNLQSAIAG